VRRIGVLAPGSDDNPDSREFAASLIKGLGQLGWVDGRNAAIKISWATSEPDRASIAANELVASQPDVLLCFSTPMTAALQKATGTIPIVFAIVSDPVGAGFVTSFSHPGGNITGFTNGAASATQGKLLDLLKQIAPGIEEVGIIFNPDTAPGGGKFYLGAFEAAARSRGVEPVILPVRSDAEIERAIATLGREHGGLVVMFDVFLSAHNGTVIAATRRGSVPAISPFAYFPGNGGLMSYGPDEPDLARRALGYVDRILRGERLADLPVQAPTKFVLTINLKTAAALGLTVPPALLAAADEVIE
jgi:putative tryptophan/tyrosine transport system substrate-binding protein